LALRSAPLSLVFDTSDFMMFWTSRQMDSRH